MLLFAVLVGVFASTSAMAEAKITYPVSVPQECVPLAMREGVPTVITSRFQGLKAKAKLARLSSKDPMVVECRAAVDRMKKSAEYAHAQATPSGAPLPTPATDARDRTTPQ